jgi:hypothetical protein
MRRVNPLEDFRLPINGTLMHLRPGHPIDAGEDVLEAIVQAGAPVRIDDATGTDIDANVTLGWADANVYNVTDDADIVVPTADDAHEGFKYVFKNGTSMINLSARSGNIDDAATYASDGSADGENEQIEIVVMGGQWKLQY